MKYILFIYIQNEFRNLIDVLNFDAGDLDI